MYAGPIRGLFLSKGSVEGLWDWHSCSWEFGSGLPVHWRCSGMPAAPPHEPCCLQERCTRAPGLCTCAHH